MKIHLQYHVGPGGFGFGTGLRPGSSPAGECNVEKDLKDEQVTCSVTLVTCLNCKKTAVYKQLRSRYCLGGWRLKDNGTIELPIPGPDMSAIGKKLRQPELIHVVDEKGTRHHDLLMCGIRLDSDTVDTWRLESKSERALVHTTCSTCRAALVKYLTEEFERQEQHARSEELHRAKHNRMKQALAGAKAAAKRIQKIIDTIDNNPKRSHELAMKQAGLEEALDILIEEVRL